jgi:hypothetical protein
MHENILKAPESLVKSTLSRTLLNGLQAATTLMPQKRIQQRGTI